MDTEHVRRALIVVSLVALGAGGLLVGLSTSAGHTATAGVRPPAHPRPGRSPHALAIAPTVPSIAGSSCFAGGTECSLTPCTELVGSSDAVLVTPSSGAYVPAPTTPRPTADCSKRATPRFNTPVATSQLVPSVGSASGASAASAALPRLAHRLARTIRLHAARR